MPKVFISYTHDSEEHKQRVGALSDRLRQWGVDCEIDQYEMSPAGGWALWSERKIEEADFVLIVCTKAYRQRFMGEERKGKGLGGRWEGLIIRQEMYESAEESGKFIPLVVDAADEPNIPPPLRGRTYYTPFDSEDSFVELYRLITNQPKKERPSLGPAVALPNKERWQKPPVRLRTRGGWILAAVAVALLATVLTVAFKIWPPIGPPPGLPPSDTPKPGPVRAEIRVFPVMPWALKPMIASNPSLYWLLLRAENHSDKPVQLDVRCEVLNEPPVATCAKQPWSISLVAGQKKDEKIDPRLTFLSTAGPDTNVDLQLTWRIMDDGGADVEGGRQTVTIRIPPRHAFYWDLKDAAGREVPKEFLVASLAAWAMTAEKNPVYQEGKESRLSCSQQGTGAVPCASMTEFLDRVYSGILTRPDRLAISPGIPQLPPAEASVDLRTPQEVLTLKKANPIEAALLVGALSQEPTEWYGMRLAGASIRGAGESDARVLILWTDPADRWHAVDLTKTNLSFTENRQATNLAQEPWFQKDVLPALARTGVFLDLGTPRRVFLEFSKAASKNGIQPFPAGQ
jgi:hypothetical protein